MNILIIGNGGREHALAQKISLSHHCGKLFIAPGNLGTEKIGTNVDLEMTNFEAIAQSCIKNNINMVIVGPEAPLVNGLYDFLKSIPALEKLIVVGPSKAGAQLEGSKDFSKGFMLRHGIPNAAYKTFTQDTIEAGRSYIRSHPLPIVIKADGLALGKGVVICDNVGDALQAFDEMLIGKKFGASSNKVVVEQFLEGIEISVFVVTDGRDYQIIGHAKDYKRVGEGDTGPNTGGMGSISPVPFAVESFMLKVEQNIIKPTIAGIEKEGLDYKGFIFFGIINCKDEPYLIEYNCRLGDPETEVVLPRLETDLLSILAAMDNGTLADVNINFIEGHFATIVAASGGYPGDYKKGIAIHGLENTLPDVTLVFHSGTKRNGEIIETNGGRVLTITSWGESLSEALQQSTSALATISFEGIFYRKDIGFEFL